MRRYPGGECRLGAKILGGIHGRSRELNRVIVADGQYDIEYPWISSGYGLTPRLNQWEVNWELDVPYESGEFKWFFCTAERMQIRRVNTRGNLGVEERLEADNSLRCDWIWAVMADLY